MNATTTTARTELHAHQKHVADLIGQASALLRRVVEFQNTATAARPPLQRLETLRDGRRELLAAVAIGESDSGALDKADAELETAEVQARGSLRGIEIAQAGSERLGREHEELAGQLAIEQRKGDALRYAAGVELAQSKLAAYRAAVEGMGAALADLQGACAAADACANPRAIPPRPWVSGGLGPMTFDPPLPALTGLDPKAWSFSIAAQVEIAEAAALAELA